MTDDKSKTNDDSAQAKRASQRLAKVQAGMQDLETWLHDIVSQGLAVVQAQPYSFWDNAAARLVDAQAPGVARLIREMASVAFSGVGWEDRLLARLGRLYLLLEGFKRLSTLDNGLQADIRTQIGWTQSQEELLNQVGVEDNWLILGQRVEDLDNLKTQRTWLWGKETKKPALILNFAYGSQPLDNNLFAGSCINAKLVFFESAYPLRSLVKTCNDTPTLVDIMPVQGTIKEMIPGYAKALSRNPWLEQFPVAIDSLIPIKDKNNWLLRDANGHQLPMKPNFQKAWQLLAVSGGYPISLFGEWDGEFFLPLSTWCDNTLVLI